MVMISRLGAAVAASLIVSAAGQSGLQVLSPGGPNLWWVAKSLNNIVWSCKSSPYGNYTVLVANKDPKILAAPIAVVAIVDNFVCSKSITQDQANQAPGPGYTVQLANPLNASQIYAESAEFEIKPLGSSYPDASATPSIDSPPAASGAGGASGTSSSGSAAAPKKTNGASALGGSAVLGMGVAAAAAVLGLVTA